MDHGGVKCFTGVGLQDCCWRWQTPRGWGKGEGAPRRLEQGLSRVPWAPALFLLSPLSRGSQALPLACHEPAVPEYRRPQLRAPSQRTRVRMGAATGHQPGDSNPANHTPCLSSAGPVTTQLVTCLPCTRTTCHPPSSSPAPPVTHPTCHQGSLTGIWVGYQRQGKTTRVWSWGPQRPCRTPTSARHPAASPWQPLSRNHFPKHPPPAHPTPPGPALS